MLRAALIIATVFAAVAANKPDEHSKPGDGYDRGHVYLMKLITYPSSGARARNAKPGDVNKGDKLASPFSRLLVLESVKNDDQNENKPGNTIYKPTTEETKPIYVKKLPNQYESKTLKSHEPTLNRHKRTICLKCLGGGKHGGYGGGYGGGGYGGGYGGGHNGGYGGGHNGGNGGGGTPTNIIIVPIETGRHPQGGGHGQGHHGGGGYRQPVYSNPGGCRGGGCGYQPPAYQQPHQQPGCNGGCGGGNDLRGSFSYAQASASSGSWNGK